MKMSLAGWWAAVVLMLPAAAVAQSGGAPSAEVGVDVAVGPGADGEWRSLAPRAALRLGRRTAIEVSLSPQRGPNEFSSVDYLIAGMRQTLRTGRNTRVFGSLGLSVARQRFGNWPGGEGSFDFPPSYTAGPVVGGGVEVQLGPHLAARGDVHYVISGEPLLRFAGGVTVPIGRYADRRDAANGRDLRGRPSGAVRPGQTAWISTVDGMDIHGEVVGRNADALTVEHGTGVTTIAADRIARIDTPDGLGNGIAIGALSGAAAGGVLGWLGGQVWCEGDSDCSVLGSLVIGGVGAGIGTVAGAVIDSLHERRRTVFQASSPAGRPVVSLAPVIGRGVGGVSGRITW